MTSDSLPIESYDRDRALYIARFTAARLERSEAAALFRSIHHESRYEPGLALGGSGLALLFSALWQVDRDVRWLNAAREHLLAATNAPRDQLGLHTGWFGIAAASRYVNRQTPILKRLEATLSTELSRVAEIRTNEAKRVSTQRRPLISDCDLISGMAGWCLSGCLTESATRSIVTFYEDLLDEPSLDAWETRDGVASTPRLRLDLAHGLGGATSALSLIESRLEMGVAKRLGKRFVSFVRESTSASTSSLSWCLGRCGIAASLASAMRHDDSDQFVALQDLEQTLLPQDTALLGSFADHGICHGTAGAILCYAHVFNATKRVDLIRCVRDGIRKMIGGFDETLPLGYRYYEPEGCGDLGGLLQGAAGTALTLLTLCHPVDPSWVRFIGLDIGDEGKRQF